MDTHALKAAILNGVTGVEAYGQNGPGADGTMMGHYNVAAVNPTPVAAQNNTAPAVSAAKLVNV